MPPPTPPTGAHLIRLRGGWERDEPGRESTPERLTLPLVGWPSGWGLTRLVRHFQHPALDFATESLALRLVSVPGLITVKLDGIALVSPDSPDTDRPLSIDPSQPRRHTLELIVDFSGTALSARTEIWGEIALVVQSHPEALGGRTRGL